MKTAGGGVAQARARVIARPVARRLWQIGLDGFERLPHDGPAILCPNHISFLDSAFLMLSVERTISFVGKAEYMDSWKTRFVFPAMGMIPIDRRGGPQSLVALEAAADVLRRGELFAIFPEGTRSRDGLLHKGRTGAARLALEIGCPIYPVGIIGTDRIQPPDARVPKLHRSCTIRIGRPVRPDRYRSRAGDRLVFRRMTDEVMFEIAALTGQRYVNTYAGRDSDAEPVLPAAVVAHVGDPPAAGATLVTS